MPPPAYQLLLKPMVPLYSSSVPPLLAHRMKSFLLLMCLVGLGFGTEWEKMDNFELTFKEYVEDAKRLIISAEGSIDTIRANASSFVNGHSKRSFANHSANGPSGDNCSETILKFERLKTSFLNQLSRSEMPLLAHIAHLKEKIAHINSSIRIYLDLADSKYLSCDMLNQTCSEDIRAWLDEVIPKIACQLTPNCQAQRKVKRSVRPCRPFEFTCKDGSCIKRQWACDGDYDCSDESDETPGCRRRCPCGFHCIQTRRCVDRSLVCNGVDDCGDNSDERNCKQLSKKRKLSVCSVEMGMHSCDDNKCIGFDHVCDNHRDCADGSDEGMNCGMGSCPDECTRRGGVCFLGPRGPICFTECPTGTFKSPAGCTSQPRSRKKTLRELLDEMPSLAERHSAKFVSLKNETKSAFAKALNDMIRCQKT